MFSHLSIPDLYFNHLPPVLPLGPGLDPSFLKYGPFLFRFGFKCGPAFLYAPASNFSMPLMPLFLPSLGSNRTLDLSFAGSGSSGGAPASNYCIAAAGNYAPFFLNPPFLGFNIPTSSPVFYRDISELNLLYPSLPFLK